MHSEPITTAAHRTAQSGSPSEGHVALSEADPWSIASRNRRTLHPRHACHALRLAASFALLAFPAASYTQEDSFSGTHPGRVWTVLVADTDAEDLAAHLWVDVGAIRHFLTEALQKRFHGQKLLYHELVGAEATPDHIRHVLGSIQAAPEDTLLFFYTGHGTMVEGDSHQYLAMKAGWISRFEVRGIMENKGARLNILLTNCCSSELPQSAFRSSDGDDEAIGQLAPGIADWRVFDDLIFRHRGTVDVTAATPGTFAICASGIGGVFTSAFLNTFQSRSEAIDRDGDGMASWPEAFADIYGRAASLYVQLVQDSPHDHPARRQQAQWAHAYSMAGASVATVPRWTQAVRQYTAQLQFHNHHNHPVKVHLSFQSVNEHNQFQWYYSPEFGDPLFYHVAGGAVINPVLGYYNQPINARAVWIQIEHPNGFIEPGQVYEFIGNDGYEAPAPWIASIPLGSHMAHDQSILAPAPNPGLHLPDQGDHSLPSAALEEAVQD